MQSPRRLFPARRSVSSPGRTRRQAGRRRATAAAGCGALVAESLEPRAMLAVTATLVNGDLVIALDGQSDIAILERDATNYIVLGTGLADATFPLADVTGRIVARDVGAAAEQQFIVQAVDSPIVNPLTIEAGIELSSLFNDIRTTVPGAVRLEAPVVLFSDIDTGAVGGDIVVAGIAGVGKSLRLSTGDGAGDITFSGTLDSLFVDPQPLTLAAGTGHIRFDGAVGSFVPLGGIVVESAASLMASSTVVLDGSGPDAGFVGIELRAVNNVTLTTPGSEIRNFKTDGISFGGGSTGSTIENLTFKDNVLSGIEVNPGDYTGTRIQRNTISGGFTGIELDASRGSGSGLLTNLLVGGGVGGDETLGNTITGTEIGVRVLSGTYTGTVIGGGNELVGNSLFGVSLSFIRVTGVNDLTVADNSIGVFRDGTPLGNVEAGIWVGPGDHEGTVIQSNRIAANGVGIALRATDESPLGPPHPDPSLFNLLIGGDKTAGQGNVIENNTGSGIEANAGDYFATLIQGNEIRGNAQQGIFLNAAGGVLEGLTIGGLGAATAGNEIADNGFATGQNGILASAGDFDYSTVIVGNAIRDNGDPVAHAGNGILVLGSRLLIGLAGDGGGLPALANTISGNAANGIEIRGADAQENVFWFNSIFENGYVDESVPGVKTIVGAGIALTDGGNAGQVAPQIVGVVNDSAKGVVRVSVMVPAAGPYVVQLFDNTPPDERGIFPIDTSGFEGRTFVAQAGPLAGNEVHVIEIAANLVAPGNWITATATLVNPNDGGRTSPFSAAVQRPQLPVLAVGSDGPLVWVPHYNYRAVSGNALRLGGLTVTEASRLAAMQGTQVYISANGRSQVATATVTSVRWVSATAVTMVLGTIVSPGGSLAGTAGRLEPGPLTLPAARLYDASSGAVLLEIGADQVAASLQAGGVSPAEADAFVSRLQGGLRVASGDANGDGFVDLLTAPGASPSRPAVTFGNAPRIITIYNGRTADAAWQSATLDVSGTFPGYSGGFQVTLGDVLPEPAGSGSVLELIVAGTNAVAVYEVTVAARGAPPVIAATPAAVWTLEPRDRITGLAAGDFSAAAQDEVVVATAAAGSGTTVRTFSVVAGSFADRATFQVASYVQGDSQRRLRDVFANGASLAVGDIDGAPDGKPELVMAAAAQGLANFRVLANELVAAGSQVAINQALTVGNGFTRTSRSQYATINGRRVWQPAGGPDYFTGIQRLPNSLARGINAPLSVAVVKVDGPASAGQVFAALGSQNTTGNMIRRLAWSSLAASWSGTDAFQAQPSGRNRFPLGGGLLLG